MPEWDRGDVKSARAANRTMTAPRHPHLPASSPPRPSRSRRGRGGFTLMEVILVLLILTVIVGITVPSLRGPAARRGVDECSGQLLALAQYARSQAVAEGVSYRLNVDVTNKLYYLSRQDGPDFYELGHEFGRQFQVPEGIELQFDDAYVAQQAQPAELTGQVQPERVAAAVPYVEFRPSGRTDPALIRVTDRDGEVTQVVCPSATETFRIVKPDGGVKQ